MAALDPARRTLSDLVDGGLSLLATSRAIGRNDAFLHQFLKRGSPRRLREDDRRHLAIHLGIDERRLGARDPWSPPALPACPPASGTAQTRPVGSEWIDPQRRARPSA